MPYKTRGLEGGLTGIAHTLLEFILPSHRPPSSPPKRTTMDLVLLSVALAATANAACAQNISPCIAQCVSTAASQTGSSCRSGYVPSLPLFPSLDLLSHSVLPAVVLMLAAPGVHVRDRTDVSCLCGPDKFQTDLLACLQQNCSPAEQRDAQRLQGEICSS